VRLGKISCQRQTAMWLKQGLQLVMFFSEVSDLLHNFISILLRFFFFRYLLSVFSSFFDVHTSSDDLWKGWFFDFYTCLSLDDVRVYTRIEHGNLLVVVENAFNILFVAFRKVDINFLIVVFVWILNFESVTWTFLCTNLRNAISALLFNYRINWS